MHCDDGTTFASACHAPCTFLRLSCCAPPSPPDAPLLWAASSTAWTRVPPASIYIIVFVRFSAACIVMSTGTHRPCRPAVGRSRLDRRAGTVRGRGLCGVRLDEGQRPCIAAGPQLHSAECAETWHHRGAVRQMSGAARAAMSTQHNCNVNGRVACV